MKAQEEREAGKEKEKAKEEIATKFQSTWEMMRRMRSLGIYPLYDLAIVKNLIILPINVSRIRRER